MRSGLRWVVLMVCASVFAGAQTAPVKPVDPLHAWVGLKSPADLDNWVRWQISEEQRLIAQMLAVKGPRTRCV